MFKLITVITSFFSRDDIRNGCSWYHYRTEKSSIAG